MSHKNVNLKLPEKTHRKLKIITAFTGKTLNEVCIKMIEEEYIEIMLAKDFPLSMDDKGVKEDVKD